MHCHELHHLAKYPGPSINENVSNTSQTPLVLGEYLDDYNHSAYLVETGVVSECEVNGSEVHEIVNLNATNGLWLGLGLGLDVEDVAT